MLDSMSGMQNKVNRRQFMGQCAHTLGSMSIMGLLLGSYSRQSVSTPAWAIRPPGAIAEDDFLGACVRCGLCVRDCPYDTLKLAEFGSEVATGTPYFIARDIPCEMCEDIPCIAACPTDALSKELTDIRDADMGIAVLTGMDTCYSVTGVAHCRACYIACPIKDEAITMEQKRVGNRTYFEPTVHAGSCTGCGKCEENCVTQEASIKVLPRQLAKHDSSSVV